MQMEAPLTSMLRSYRAARAETDLYCAIAVSCESAFYDRPVRFKDEGPATSPLRRSVARCAEAHRLAKRRTGRFLVWDFRPMS